MPAQRRHALHIVQAAHKLHGMRRLVLVESARREDFGKVVGHLLAQLAGRLGLTRRLVDALGIAVAQGCGNVVERHADRFAAALDFLSDHLQRDHRLRHKAIVEIHGLGRIGHDLRPRAFLGNDAHDDFHHEPDERQPEQGHSDVERRVGVRDLARNDLDFGARRRNGLNECSECGDEPNEDQASGDVEQAVRHGHALGVAALSDAGKQGRDRGADVVAQQHGNRARQTDNARHAVGAGGGSQVLQHRDGGRAALDDDRHDRAYGNAQNRHVDHLGNHIDEHGTRGQRLHRIAHGLDAQEQKTEAQDAQADALHTLGLGDERNQEADEHERQDVIGDFEGDDLRRDRGADVGAQNDRNGLGQAHQARAHEADRHDRRGARALQHGRRQRAGQNAENRIFSQKGKDILHLFAGDLLQVVAHHIHTEDEDGKAAKKTQGGRKHGVHESVLLSSYGGICMKPSREQYSGRNDSRRLCKCKINAKSRGAKRGAYALLSA